MCEVPDSWRARERWLGLFRARGTTALPPHSFDEGGNRPYDRLAIPAATSTGRGITRKAFMSQRLKTGAPPPRDAAGENEKCSGDASIRC